MAGRCIVFDRRSGPMVMESRIVSARFLSSRNTLSPRIRLAFAFSDALRVPGATDAFQFDERRFLLFPSLFSSFGFFVSLSLFAASTARRTKGGGGAERSRNFRDAKIQSRRIEGARAREQEICGGDGENVTPRLHGTRRAWGCWRRGGRRRPGAEGIQTFGFALGRLNDALQGLRALRR